MITTIDKIIGKAVVINGEKLLVSHYSMDGEMITLYTTSGEKSFLKNETEDFLKNVQLVSQTLKDGTSAITGVREVTAHNGLQATTEYERFTKVSSNRKVNAPHVKRLIREIQDKNLLHLNPIIVDSSYRVIDGQHRLEAARTLQLPIYYIVDNGVNKTDIAALNSNKKNWSLVDYINFHTQEDRPGFRQLSNFMHLYPKLPVSSALVLLSKTGRRDTQAIREGFVDVSNADQAEEICEFLVWLSDLYEHVYVGGCVQAVREMFNAEGFDVDRLKQKISLQPRSLVKCINKRQYLEMFVEVYNYKSSINRLSI